MCRELRKAGVQTPIIMMTAKAQEAEKVLGLDLGADDYVTKPFSPRELRARIRAALRRGATTPQAAEVFRFGDIEVDAERCEVRRGGAVVDTTATEFKLLSVFVRNRGRVLSRDKLLDQAWGEGVPHRSRRRQPHRRAAAEDRAGPGGAEVPGQRARAGVRFDG